MGMQGNLLGIASLGQHVREQRAIDLLLTFAKLSLLILLLVHRR